MHAIPIFRSGPSFNTAVECGRKYSLFYCIMHHIASKITPKAFIALWHELTSMLYDANKFGNKIAQLVTHVKIEQ